MEAPERSAFQHPADTQRLEQEDERSTLLSSLRLSGSFQDQAGKAQSHTACGTTWWKAYSQEWLRLLHLGIPLSTISVLTFTSSLISLAFVGHLSKEALAAAVLGTSLFNVTGLSVLIGLVSALETLCGQNHGAGNHAVLGVLLQRSLVVSVVVCALIVALWTQLEQLLQLLGQDAAISRLASRYVLLLSPALACVATSESLRRYLLAQGIVTPTTVVSLVSTALSPLWNWLLVIVAGLRLDGAALAVVAVQMTTLGGIAGYTAGRDRRLQGTEKQSWHGWTLECLRGWDQYLRIALPSLAMTCVEWWAFEVIVLLAGLLPDPELSVGVVGICLNVAAWIFMLPNGAAGAASTRVANELGAGNWGAARVVVHTSLALVLCLMALVSTIVALLRRPISHLFSQDPATVAETAGIMPLLAVLCIGDGANAVLAGVVRGCGRQALGAGINAVTYWLLGIPLAATLAFKAKLGVWGLWAGLAVTSTMQGTVMSIVVLSFSWQQEAKRAARRMQQDPGKLAAARRDTADVELAVPEAMNANAALALGTSVTAVLTPAPQLDGEAQRLSQLDSSSGCTSLGSDDSSSQSQPP